MRQARDAADLIADPIGKFLVTRTWVYAHPDAAFDCTIVRGRSEPAEAELLVRCWNAAMRPGARPHTVLFDAAGITAIDVRAFDALASFVRERRERYAELVSRVANVMPAGLTGSVVAGFFDVVGVPSEGRNFVSRADAMAWLGRAELTAEVDRLAAMLDEDPLLRELRGLILAQPTLAKAARELGVSPRSLQRKLAEAGTSFQRELAAARVAAAERRLLDTDDKIEAIAIDVGCASLQSFGAMFRRVTGESPAEWRRRRTQGETRSSQSPSAGTSSKSSPGSG